MKIVVGIIASYLIGVLVVLYLGWRRSEKLRRAGDSTADSAAMGAIFQAPLSWLFLIWSLIVVIVDWISCAWGRKSKKL